MIVCSTTRSHISRIHSTRPLNPSTYSRGWFSKEVLKFKYWYDKLIAMLTVHALKIKIDEIVQGTMKMAPTWIRNLKEEERKELEILLASILNKAIIDPIIVFKEHSGDGDETPYIAVIRRLFKLDTDFHVHN